MKNKMMGAALVLGAVLMGLAGCGSGSSSYPKQVTYSGTVLTDGRVVGATVCLDENANLECDTDEATTVTDGNGEFVITAAETDANLVAASVEGVTISLEPRNLAIAPKAGSVPPGTRLTAPNNAQIISLFTTLAQVRAITTGVSIAAAEQQVITALGLPAGTTINSFDYSGEDTDPRVQAAAQTVASLASANLSVILGQGGALKPTETTILAFDHLFATDGGGQSRLERITQTLAGTNEADLNNAVLTLTQQELIDANDVQAGLDRITEILNNPPEEPTDPTGATGGG